MNDNSIFKEMVDAFNTTMNEEHNMCPVTDKKIKTAIRAGAFAIMNSKFKYQCYWDGKTYMDFTKAVTILLQLVGDLQPNEELHLR